MGFSHGLVINKKGEEMKKIPTIFKRNPDNLREILDEPHPDCLWIFNGEGIATRKYDGTCVKIENGEYYKRREIKKDGKIPDGFIEEDFDSITGKHVGWIKVNPNDPGDKYHMEAFNPTLPDGTYELLGPKIQGNPEGCSIHTLIAHKDAQKFFDIPRAFEGLKSWLVDKDIEGIVFYHPDGRMGKIKKRDFGLKRK